MRDRSNKVTLPANRWTEKFYVTLGTAPPSTPLTLQLGFGGWGATQSFTLDIVADWAGRATSTSPDRVTAYIHEQKANIVGQRGSLIKIYYVVITGGRIAYYLSVDGA